MSEESAGNGALLLVRVADRAGALERVLGLLRRKALRIRRISPVRACDALELLLRYDPTQARTERLEAELRSLIDVQDVRRLDGDGVTRELALVHLRLREAPPADLGRIVGTTRGGVILELTGSPAEVDRAIDRLRESGVLIRATRTGEIAIPELSHPHRGGTSA